MFNVLLHHLASRRIARRFPCARHSCGAKAGAGGMEDRGRPPPHFTRVGQRLLADPKVISQTESMPPASVPVRDDADRPFSILVVEDEATLCLVVRTDAVALADAAAGDDGL